MRICCAFVFVLVCGEQPCVGAPLDDIFSNLTMRRESVKTAYYKVTGTKLDVKSSLGEGPKEDHTSAVEAVVKVDLNRNWIVKRKKTEMFDFDELKYKPWMLSVFFDGSVARLHQHYDEDARESLSDFNPDVFVGTLARNADVYSLEYSDYPIFVYHGFLLSESVSRLKLQHINPKAQAAEFEIIGDVRLGAVDCYVIRDARQGVFSFEYCVQKAQPHNVLRMDCLVDRKLDVRIDIQPKRHEDTWVPDSWECVTVGENGFKFLEKYRVQHVVLNEEYSQDQFQGDKIESGRIVKDHDQKGFFRMTDDGTLARFVPGAGNTRPLFWYAALTLGVVLVVVAIVAWRRAKAVPRR